jgi:hypothetical protein
VANEDTLIAPVGEKTIVVEIHFWTAGISPEKGFIIPKHCWDGGWVRVESNPSHGISGGAEAITFNRLVDVPGAVMTALEKERIKLHPLRHTARLYDL